MLPADLTRLNFPWPGDWPAEASLVAGYQAPIIFASVWPNDLIGALGWADADRPLWKQVQFDARRRSFRAGFDTRAGLMMFCSLIALLGRDELALERARPAALCDERRAFFLRRTKRTGQKHAAQLEREILAALQVDACRPLGEFVRDLLPTRTGIETWLRDRGVVLQRDVDGWLSNSTNGYGDGAGLPHGLRLAALVAEVYWHVDAYWEDALVEVEAHIASHLWRAPPM